MSRDLKLLGRLLFAIAAVLLACWWAFALFVREPTEAPNATRPVPALPVPEDEVTVHAVHGKVEHAQRGTWAPVREGQRLGADESLRTDAKGGAELRIGEGAWLEITESSELAVREVTRALHRFQLVSGRLKVDYAANEGRKLRIESAEGDTVAETTGARFSILSNGVAVAVATEAGAVNLRSGDQVVEVREGQQSVAVEGRPPSTPSAIPTELLLKVAAAAAGKRCAMEGRTAPGAQVWVDGAPAMVGADGRFSVAIANGTGAEVRLRDVSGHEARKKVSCGPPDHPITRMSIEW